ncbi:uncharacterized protein isoform X2 [Musca autumnalis]|uniref:uncharacterized protein isoform X2 n=1 Tax=Musca autumnalis TaxID=221902 RepID=UPI003CF8B459
MWKEVKIVDKIYYSQCNIGANNQVTLILYDLNEIWSESIPIDELKRKVKVLNRRYDFNEENIRKTLCDGGDLETALLESADRRSNDKVTLKVKYRVKDCPFHYEWNLTKQTLKEFQSFFVKPMLQTLVACKEQIEILTETVRKKDAEIQQYRKDGAILGRKTLATKLFAFEEFDRKYEVSNKLLNEFSVLGQFLAKDKTAEKQTSPIKSKVEKQEKQETTTVHKMPPTSPAQKKGILKKQMMQDMVGRRKPVIEYQNSQSESQTTEDDLQFDTEKCNTKEDNKRSNANDLKKKDSSESKTTAKESESSPASKCGELKRLVSDLVIAENPAIEEHKTRGKHLQTNPVSKNKEIKSSTNDSAGSSVKNGESNKVSAKTLESNTARNGEDKNKISVSPSASKPATKNRELQRLVSNLVIAENPSKQENAENKTKEKPKKLPRELKNLVSDLVGVENPDNSEPLRGPSRNSEKKLEKKSTDNESPRKRRKSTSDMGETNSQSARKLRTFRCLNFEEERSETESEVSIMATALKRKQSVPLSKQSEDDDDCADPDQRKTNQKGEENKSNKTDDKSTTNKDHATKSAETRKEESKKNPRETTDSDDSDVIDITPRKKKRTHSTKQLTIEKSLQAIKIDDGKNVATIAAKSIQSLDICDTDSDGEDADVPRTPRRSKNLSLTRRTATPENRKTTNNKKDNNNSEASVKVVSDDCQVVEISTDSESNYPHTSSKSPRPSSATKKSPLKSPMPIVIKTKVTRSTPQVLSTPKVVDSSNNSSQSDTRTGGDTDDITLQLETIRKELQFLEAQRLADLEARTCKA